MVIFRNILAVVLGFFIGSYVNMSLIEMGYSTYPIEGVDTTDMAAVAEAMPTLGAKHFIFPFLAHAAGTLVGALVAGLVAASNKMRFSMVIGGLFLIFGILMSFAIPAPFWFIALDLLIAYIPMAWLGGKLASVLSKMNIG